MLDSEALIKELKTIERKAIKSTSHHVAEDFSLI